MRTLSFINLKGGTGKTTLSTNTAIAFAQNGAKVLFIDNDKQGNTSAFFNANPDVGLDDLYLTNATAKDVIQKTVYPNLDIISGSMNLKAVEIKLLQKDNAISASILEDKLRPVFSKYDLCVIDNPPDVGVTVINALLFTTDVIVVTTPDEDSISGVDEIYTQLNSINAKGFNIKCVFNQYLATDLSWDYKEYLKKKYSVFETTIRFNRKFLQIAKKEKKPVFEISARCGFSQDFFKFMSELTKQA